MEQDLIEAIALLRKYIQENGIEPQVQKIDLNMISQEKIKVLQWEEHKKQLAPIVYTDGFKRILEYVSVL